jgi:hypothetical protein
VRVQRVRECLIQRHTVTDVVIEGEDVDPAAILVPNGLTLGVRTYQRINSRGVLGRENVRLCTEDQGNK